MGTATPLKTLFAALLVVAFGWGSFYGIVKGVKYFQKSNAGETVAAIDTYNQKALTLEAYVDNPAVPAIKKTGKANHTLTIMIGGDVMMDRGIRAIGERNGYDSLFSDALKALFKKADIAMANLEGPITANPSKTLVDGKTTDSFTFTSSPAAAKALNEAGINIVSLANNHIDNFGSAGYLDTQRYLRDAGLEWFGNPWNSTSTKLTIMETSDGSLDSPVATMIEKNGIKVAFIGYHAFQLGVDRVVSEIRRVSGPDVFTIVMPHWGEEYVTTPSAKMRSYARAFITAGADAVIGAHPHVVADQEWVGAVPVFYSLGNLLFDQYFSDETKQGMIVELAISQNEAGITLDHLTTHDVFTKPGIGASLEK